MRIALVGCGKSKLDHAAPARDLYTGPLFRASRAWAEKHCDRWFVLSAKHGLVAPETVIEPYDVTLAKLSSAGRTTWADTTAAQFIRATGGLRDVIFFLAGDQYREVLPYLANPSREPLRGLQIGQRLAWLNAQLAVGPVAALWERMRAAVDDGEFGRAEFTAAECAALLAERGSP